MIQPNHLYKFKFNGNFFLRTRNMSPWYRQYTLLKHRSMCVQFQFFWCLLTEILAQNEPNDAKPIGKYA